jgi:hypothetical protein
VPVRRLLGSRAAALTGLAAAIAVVAAILLLTTDPGAGVIARARCIGVWLTADSQSYGACHDFEREQILEERRHTPQN